LGEDSRVGKFIGNYEVLKRLGKGGFGTVYLAEHPDIDRQVAVKVLHLEGEELERRFIREARSASRIKHPNVIEVFDLGTTEDGEHYYMMEVLKGMEFEEVLRRATAKNGRMTPEELYPYLEQICQALQAAHDMNVIHRDLKPENMFVVDGSELQVKVLDFGIAKVLADARESMTATRTGMVMGSPLYMPPEQVAGEHHLISARSDIYSMGVIIYRCLTGDFPLYAETLSQLILKQSNSFPKPLKERVESIPDALSELVMDCLSKFQEERPGSARELIERYRRATGIPEPADGEEVWSVDFASGSDGGWSESERDLAMAKTEPPPLDDGTVPSVEPGHLSEAIAVPSRKNLYLALGAGVCVLALVVVFLVGGQREEPGMAASTPPATDNVVGQGIQPDAAPVKEAQPAADLGTDMPAKVDKSAPRPKKKAKKAIKPRPKKPAPKVQPAPQPPPPVEKPKPEPEEGLDLPL